MPKMKDITVFRELYDPHADGYLVTGRLKDESAPKPYIMGWRRRHGQTLIEPRSYSSKGWLTRSFREALENDEWPHDRQFFNDRHKDRLYRWEDQYLAPHTQRISEKQARQLIKDVSKDYGIEPPALRWRAENASSSFYLGQDHSITFHHRDRVSLLHEIGHAIHGQNDENDKGAHHSPAFTRIVMELYHKYAGFRLDYLMVTANIHNLLGDMKSEQIIFDPTKHPKF